MFQTINDGKGGFLLYLSKKQSWHIEPPWGLMNDPNGLIWYRGNYDVFFQWNRFKKDHSSKAWGWCISPDLIHWRFCGSALLPDQPYDVAKGSIREVQSKSIIGCVCTTPATRGAMAAGSAVNVWLSVRMECIFKSVVRFLLHLLVTRSIFVT